MKKLLPAIISLLLICALMFTGCADLADDPKDTVEDTTADTSDNKKDDENTYKPNKEPIKYPSNNNNGTYTVKESYMPEHVSAQMKDIFENQKASFITYTYGSCPYVIRDVYTISNCKLLSISIPVSKTLAADENGDFLFTITVGNNGWYQIQNTPKEVYDIYVNAEEHGITENTTGVNKWIKVDLSEYNIDLSVTETIGFGHSRDTLIPAYIGNGDVNNAAQQLIENEFPQIRGFVSKMGKGETVGTSPNTLIYDFEWERSYKSEEAYLETVAAEEAYQQLLAKVKEQYKGKKLSILGDSISTFNGYSNNTSYNSTIGNNAVYYYKNSGGLNGSGLYDHRDTYWYRLIEDLEMELCVDNAWSGSKVLDKNNMPGRATQLHNNKGENPDVIIFYMGINDLHNNSAFGDLYALLESSTDKRDDNTKIAEWFANVSVSGMSTFEQAYALSLQAMTNKYKDAEVWCMTLNVNKDTRFSELAMIKYNRCITALAEYFGADVINQQEGYITLGNCVPYSCDNKGLHPNPTGHALMEKHIIETFYDKILES